MKNKCVLSCLFITVIAVCVTFVYAESTSGKVEQMRKREAVTKEKKKELTEGLKNKSLRKEIITGKLQLRRGQYYERLEKRSET